MPDSPGPPPSPTKVFSINACAVKDALRVAPPQTPAQIASTFRPASKTRIQEILETLTALGQTRHSAGRYSL